MACSKVLGVMPSEREGRAKPQPPTRSDWLSSRFDDGASAAAWEHLRRAARVP